MYRFYYAQILNKIPHYEVGKEYDIDYIVGESEEKYKIKVTIVAGTLIFAYIIK
jgi:hypothetical protein